MCVCVCVRVCLCPPPPIFLFVIICSSPHFPPLWSSSHLFHFSLTPFPPFLPSSSPLLSCSPPSLYPLSSSPPSLLHLRFSTETWMAPSQVSQEEAGLCLTPPSSRPQSALPRLQNSLSTQSWAGLVVLATFTFSVWHGTKPAHWYENMYTYNRLHFLHLLSCLHHSLFPNYSMFSPFLPPFLPPSLPPSLPPPSKLCMVYQSM